MQHLLHTPAQGFVLARHHSRGQRVLRHFSRQVRSGQHANARLRRDLLENLAHQHEAVRLDAFGGTDQHLAAELRRERLQCLAQRAGRQRNEDQLAGIEGRRQIGGRLDLRKDLDAFQIARVLSQRPDAFGLLRIAHPEQDVVTILGQQIGDRGTETAAAEYRDGLLSCHVESVVGHPKWQCRALYVSSSQRPAQPPSPVKSFAYGRC